MSDSSYYTPWYEMWSEYDKNPRKVWVGITCAWSQIQINTLKHPRDCI